MLSPAPSVLALTIRVVPTGLPALLITPVHFAPPTPLALQPTRHAAIGMAAVARAADVEQTPTSAVTAKTLSENDFPTARAHSTVLSLDSTPAIVASFKPLVARASFAGGGPPKTPVALDDRGFFFARTISRKRVARLTARMMTGPAQLDGWSENCGFTGSATVMSNEPYRSAPRVFWILDNGTSHRGQRCVDRLRQRWPNVIVVHLPKHASWLNPIEIYFSVVQRKALTPADFASLDELKERILRFQEHYQKVARPFEWRFTCRDLAKLLDKLKSNPLETAA